MAKAMATQSKKDVCYWVDDMDCVCLDLYAKALDIIDGNNPDYWDYDMLEEYCHLFMCKVFVSHASLKGGSRLEVKGELGPWCNLTPNTLYFVYFDIRLSHKAKGFRHNPVTFEFTDQNQTPRRFSEELVHGDTIMLMGKFNWDPNNPHNVTAKIYNSNHQEKSGLLVRRMRVTHGEHGHGPQRQPERSLPRAGSSDGRDDKKCLASKEERDNGFWASFIEHYGKNINQFNIS